METEFLAHRREAISLTRAQEVPLPGTLRKTNTTYFCIADAKGNALSFIQSVYHPFGCGVVIEGTGIPMHALNAYLITKGEALAYVGGTPRGDIQVQSNLQVISQLVDFGLDPQQPIERPRWAWQPLNSTDPSPGRLSLEGNPGDSETNARVEELRKRGHSVSLTALGTHPSAVQVIQRLNESYLAGSDSRAEGQAGGF